MYQLKTNEKSGRDFGRQQEVLELDEGFFYEDKEGNRFLVMFDVIQGKYAVCISSISGKQGTLYGRFVKVSWRLVEPGTEFTFTQQSPIPF